jgi:hypothetical protein
VGFTAGAVAMERRRSRARGKRPKMASKGKEQDMEEGRRKGEQESG